MRYFKELSRQEQEIVIGNLMNLNILACNSETRNLEQNNANTRDFLMCSRVHMFDNNLGLHTLSQEITKC